MKAMHRLKRTLRLLQRSVGDLRTGRRQRFAGPVQTDAYELYVVLSLTQPLRPTATFQNKLDNIRLACERIGPVVVLPGQIFSFWHIVGPPVRGRGFKVSRNIVGGRLSEAVGGGLCQVSGILYHMALLAGLEIGERHPHSVDIYREEERHTPLGADATVVYGYKDLRFSNNRPHPLRFRFEINENRLVCHLLANKPVDACAIEFERESLDGLEQVTTRRNGTPVAVSRYRKMVES